MSKSRYRYYCLYRPPMPGTIPRGVVGLETFDDNPFIEEINHTAWGYVEYEIPLDNKEVRAYELAIPQKKNASCNTDYCNI